MGTLEKDDSYNKQQHIFCLSQSCNSALQSRAEEGDNSLRERYREKSAEVRKLQSKIMVSWTQFTEARHERAEWRKSS